MLKTATRLLARPLFAARLFAVPLFLSPAFLTPALLAPMLALPAAPAYAAVAASIDQAGATALKPGIAGALDALAASLQGAGIQMLRTGDLMVEPAGSYYAITTPSIVLKMPGGITRTVGMVAINAIPTTDPSIYKVAVALPTPMLDTDAAGKNVGSLSLGRQAMNGFLNLKALNFTELNANYSEVRFVNATTNTEMLLPQASVTLRLAPNGASWSGPLEAAVNNFAWRDAKQRYSAGTLTVQVNLDQMNLAARKDKAADEAAGSNLLTAFAAYLARNAEGADVTVTARNLAFESTVAGTAQTGSIASASFQTTLTGLKSGLAGGNFAFASSGGTSASPAMARFLPSVSDIRGTVAKLDVPALLTADTMGETFRKNTTALDVQAIKIDAPAYGIFGNTRLTGNARAPLGLTGDGSLTIRGMPELTSWLGSGGPQAMGMPAVPPAFVAALAMFQMAGLPATDPNGQPALKFDMSFAADGKIVLNNADISGLAESLKAKK